MRRRRIQKVGMIVLELLPNFDMLPTVGKSDLLTVMSSSIK